MEGSVGRPVPLGPGLPPQAGPRQYEPQGKRFTIDRNAVDYMGWTFQVQVTYKHEQRPSQLSIVH